MSPTVNYRKVTPDDLAQLETFYYTDYLPDEPLTLMMGIVPNELSLWVQQVLEKVVEDDLSFIAEDDASKTIVGVQIVGKQQKNDTPYNIPDTEENAKLKMILQASDDAYGGVDIFDYCGCDEIASVRTLAVRRGYRNRGIAKQLATIAVDECRKQGFKFAVVEASNVHSSAVYDRLGFERLREAKFEGMTLDGQSIVKKLDGVNTQLVIHTKKL